MIDVNRITAFVIFFKSLNKIFFCRFTQFYKIFFTNIQKFKMSFLKNFVLEIFAFKFILFIAIPLKKIISEFASIAF